MNSINDISTEETWSRNKNSRLPFDVNGKLNFPNISIFFHVEKRNKKYFLTHIYFVCYRFNIVSFFALRAQNDGQFSMFLN